MMLYNSTGSSSHRRRIKTEEKVKVVASFFWGGEIYSIPSRALAILPRTILKNKINSSFISNHPMVQFILLFKIVSVSANSVIAS